MATAVATNSIYGRGFRRRVASAGTTPALASHRPSDAPANFDLAASVTEFLELVGPFLIVMKALFGFHMPNFTFPGVPNEGLFDRVVHQAKAAENAGFGLVTVMDHFYQIRGIGPETDPMMEAYTTLGALAANTSTARLGTLVTGVTYRNPAILAKQVTTLDVISQGRAMLGIGGAWDELEEAPQICRAMFRDERPTFGGRYYSVKDAINRPAPVQPGGPPILVGGQGE